MTYAVGSWVYATLLQAYILLEVETDAQGIVASSLRTVLENWPKDKPKPKVLYTVPVRSFCPVPVVDF